MAAVPAARHASPRLARACGVAGAALTCAAVVCLCASASLGLRELAATQVASLARLAEGGCREASLVAGAVGERLEQAASGTGPVLATSASPEGDAPSAEELALADVDGSLAGRLVARDGRMAYVSDGTLTVRELAGLMHRDVRAVEAACGLAAGEVVPAGLVVEVPDKTVVQGACG